MSDELNTKTPSGKKMELAIQSVNGIMLPANFKETIDFANIMARGGVAVPKHLRENAGACLAIIHSAMAWGIDAWMLARKSYAVNDIIAFEAQVFATVMKLRAPIREKVIPYVFEGQGPNRKCKITLHHAETDELIEYESPAVSQIEPKKSPLWKYEPDQALAYWSIRAVARRHFPELLSGAYDVDEAHAMRDITPKAPVNFLETSDNPVDGDVLPPVNVRTQSVEPVEIREEAEEPSQPVDPSIIARNLLAYATTETDAVLLQAWQHENQATINSLPPDLSREVITALNKRYDDLDPM